MTYCLSLFCEEGIVFVSDSRSSAGMDNINVHRKMHVYESPGERVICLMSSGNLSLTQSVLALIEEDKQTAQMAPEHPHLMNQRTLFETARYVGVKMREVAQLDRAYLEKDNLKFNIHFLVGGQILGSPHQICYVYPQGNVMHASEDSPFLQIGESKYGKPILDRTFSYHASLNDALKFGILSMDSTMKSNISVGPPIDVMSYEKDSLCVRHQMRIDGDDPGLIEISKQWSQGLLDLSQTIPDMPFPDLPED